MLEEIKRCRIQPLQIIEKKNERVFLAREHREEAPEDHLEPVLRVLRRQLRSGWLFSDHEFQLGHEIHHELTVRAQRIGQGVPPAAKLCFTLAEERADQALEGLAQSRVWDVALVLIELAGREQAAPRNQRL